MKKTSFAVAFAATLVAGSAIAADLPSKKAPLLAAPAVSPWDFTVGGGLSNDYIFRGITQSNHQPSVTARAELRYNINDNWLVYAGLAGYSIKLSPFVAGPSMELDVTGGVRATYGKFGLDLGVIGYLYPNTPVPVFAPNNISWVEYAVKPTYAVTDWLTIGANFAYTPSYIATGAHGEYLSGTAKVTLPYDISLSGEFGRQYLGKTKPSWAGYVASNVGFTARQLPSYNYYNIGASYTYKIATLDLRYHGTSLSKAAAAQLTGVNNLPNVGLQNRSSYGRSAFVATLSFDISAKDLK